MSNFDPIFFNFGQYKIKTILNTYLNTKNNLILNDYIWIKKINIIVKMYISKKLY